MSHLPPVVEDEENKVMQSDIAYQPPPPPPPPSNLSENDIAKIVSLLARQLSIGNPSGAINTGPPGHTPASNLNSAMLLESPVIRGIQYDNPSDSFDGRSVSSKQMFSRVKLPTPRAFDGTAKAKTMATTLTGFTGSMDRYLEANEVDPTSLASLRITVLFLQDGAINWYNVFSTSEPNTVRSWKDLKEQLKIRYLPVAQQHLSLDLLLDVKYRGSIEKFNEEFLTHLQQIPSYNEPAAEPLIMGMYAKRIRDAPGTSYISTVINNAITEKKVKTIGDLQSVALIAETNSAKSRVNLPYTPNNGHRSTNNSTSYPNRSTNWSSNFQNRNSNNNQNRNFPPRTSSFTTPQRVNNIECNEDAYSYEQECGDVMPSDEIEVGMDSVNRADDERDNESDINADGIDDSSDNNSFLNAVRLYNAAKEFNPKLTDEEISRRRKNNTCFRCNRPGHIARNCPLLQQKPAPKKY